MGDGSYRLSAAVCAMPASDADKLIAAGSGDCALLYIYLLRCGPAPDEELCRALGMDAGRLAAAAGKLRSLGLLATGAQRLPPAQELPQYTSEEVVRRTGEDPAFRGVLSEAERLLGHTLSGADADAVARLNLLGWDAILAAFTYYGSVLILEVYCIKCTHPCANDGIAYKNAAELEKQHEGRTLHRRAEDERDNGAKHNKHGLVKEPAVHDGEYRAGYYIRPGYQAADYQHHRRPRIGNLPYQERTGKNDTGNYKTHQQGYVKSEICSCAASAVRPGGAPPSQPFKYFLEGHLTPP